MDEKITIELDRETIEALSKQAERHGHSLDDEVRDIVRSNVQITVGKDRQALMAEARRIRAMTPVGVQHTDSVTLIREDRDR